MVFFEAGLRRRMGSAFHVALPLGEGRLYAATASAEAAFRMTVATVV
jgi:hypothetical protein